MSRVTLTDRPKLVEPQNHIKWPIATRPSTTPTDQRQTCPVHHTPRPIALLRPRAPEVRPRGPTSAARPRAPTHNATTMSMRKRHMVGHSTQCKTLLHLLLFQGASTVTQRLTVSPSKQARCRDRCRRGPLFRFIVPRESNATRGRLLYLKNRSSFLLR